jgi:CheY-like chemotaxis protein
MTSCERTLLVVDDNEMNLLVAHDTLEADGYQVYDARTVEEAERLVETVCPALIVLDWHLTGVTGADLVARLQTAGPPRPRILVVTADIRPAVHEGALRAGVDAVLTKPYRGTELVQAVRALLSHAP